MLSASMGAFFKEKKQEICGNLRRCLISNAISKRWWENRSGQSESRMKAGGPGLAGTVLSKGSALQVFYFSLLLLRTNLKSI